MTRKDYIAVAEVLHDAFAEAETREVRDSVAGITEKMCELFKADNPDFSRSRFYTAVFEP